jgi:hypothetical protein
MPTKTSYTALRVKWEKWGLSEQQADDLTKIAEELTVVTGKPIGSCLDDVDRRVAELLTDRMLGRVADTIIYGSDLGK